MRVKLTMLILLLGILSCSEDDDIEGDDDCFTISEIPIVGLNSPTSGAVNEVIDVEVALSFPSRCTSFNGFEETVDGNIRTVKAKPIELCRTDNTCAAIILSIEVYEFIATEPGQYTLNFVSSNNTVQTVQVTIE